MKKNNSKVNIVWIAGAAALVILILLLSACTGKQPEDVPAVQTTEATVAPTAAPTVPATEAGEEATEATASTEETTAPTESFGTVTGSGTTTEAGVVSDEVLAKYPSIEDFGEEPEEDDSEEAVTVEVPAPGTQTNPYVEMLAAYPAEIVSVNIPGGESSDYLILGSAGTVLTIENPNAEVSLGELQCKADANGVVTLDLTQTAEDPVIRITNGGTEAAAYTVHITEAPGGRTNPHSITLTQIPGSVQTAQIPAEASVYYSIENAGGTILTLTEPAVRVTYNDTVHELPAPEASEEETADPTDATASTEAVETAEEPPASEPETAEPQVLTLELESAEENQPVLLQLTNIGADTAVYTMNFAYPLGAEGNPEPLTSLESVTASLKAGDLDGYHYSWIPALDGTVTITADPAVCHVTLMDPADGREAAAEDGTVSLDVQMGNALRIRVMAVQQEDGTYPAAEAVLQGTFTPAPGTSAEDPLVIDDPLEPVALSFSAGETVYLSGMFQEMIATLDNGADMTALFEEQTVLAARSGILTLEFPAQEGEEPAPLLFALTSAVGQDSVLTFGYPEGHRENPAALLPGENEVRLEENDPEGFWLAWTAECDGFLTLSLEEGAQWQLSVEDPAAETGLRTYTSADDPLTAEITLEVKQYQQVRMNVNTLPAEAEGNPPDGAVTIAASFFDPLLGTEAKPLALDAAAETVNTLTVEPGQTLYCSAQAEGMILTLTGSEITLLHNGAEYPAEEGPVVLTIREADSLLLIRSDAQEAQTAEIVFTYPLGQEKNPIWLDMEDQITIPAGKTMYCTAKADGMVMTLTGAELSVLHNGAEYLPEEDAIRIPCEGANTFEPPLFAITNHGAQDAVCDVSFEYPLGHFMNPIPLELGENSAVMEENNAGCYFQWTAEAEGTLTVTIQSEGNWEYVMNNLTTGVNGDIFCSADTPAVPAQTAAVSAGDEIQLILHICDGAEGQVDFTAEFTAPQPETAPTA